MQLREEGQDMSRAEEILELYMPDAGADFSIKDTSAFVQAKRSADRDPEFRQSIRISKTKLLDKKYYQPPEEVQNTVDNMPQQQQQQAVGQLAQAIEQEDPNTKKEIEKLPRSVRKRVLIAIGAGAFWTAAIYSMPWLGVSLLGIRLFQRYKAATPIQKLQTKIKETPPRWL